MDPEIFIKPNINFRTTSNFLKDIWHPTERRNQTSVVYSDYCLTNERRTSNFLNDFVNHRTYRSLHLSSDQIQGIHENNVKHASSDASRVKNTEPSHSTTEWSPDDLLTDSLMDKFNIRPGERQTRLKQFYIHSQILFHYLICQLGNEEIVNLRRRIMKAKFSSELNIGSEKVRMIVRGSRSEGLNMKGTDTDILIEYGLAYENRTDITTDITTEIFHEYNSMTGSFGYVTVNIVWNGQHTTISSDMLKKFSSHILQINKYLILTKIHGPSIAVERPGDKFDNVLCLRSVDWPEIAHEWIYRKRNYGWPSQEMINFVVRQGCHIVPIGNKEKREDEVEWRLSFSEAEEELVWSFSHVQLLVYGLLKIILKEILNQNENTAELLCSYFMKTVMFWVIEETNAALWTPKYIMLCFHLCLERLIQFVIEQDCPNYFIPVNNMFEKRFSLQNKGDILQILCSISENGLRLKIPSMGALEGYFLDPNAFNNLELESKKNITKEICEIASELIRFGKCVTFLLGAGAFETHLASQYLKTLRPKSRIGTYAANQVCHFIDLEKYKRVNKETYIIQKLFLRLLLNTCKEDLVSGKALLATWLQNQGRHNDCIEVVEHAQECLNYRIMHIGPKAVHHVISVNNVIECGNMSLFDIFHNCNMFATCFVPIPLNSVLMPPEIKCLFSVFLPILIQLSQANPSGFGFFPDSYCHFLKCKSYLSLGKIDDFEKEYGKLKCEQVISSPDEDVMNTLSGICLQQVLQLIKYIKAIANNAEITSNDFEERDTLLGSCLSIFKSLPGAFRRLGLDINVMQEACMSNGLNFEALT